MNFLGHAHVAPASGRDDPLHVLGAVLPDLASMAGVRVPRDALPEPLAAGVRCHVDADATFHAHPEFRLGAAGIRSELAAVGLGSGAGRAVGHIGWELLLDGQLVDSPAEEAYWKALAWGDEVTAVLSGDDRRRWQAFLAHRDRRPRLRYDDPGWVADRVYAALARRPRLRFPADRVPDVAGVLDSHAAAVADAAPTVFDDVVAGLRP